MCNINNCYEGDMPLGVNQENPLLEQHEEYSPPFESMDSPGQMEGFGQLGNLTEMPYNSKFDTDSESEDWEHEKEFGSRCTAKIYWRRAIDFFKSWMSPQRQKRMEMTLRQSHAYSVFDHVLLLLQLLHILLIGTVGQGLLAINFGQVGQGLLLAINFGHTSHRLWQCKFQLRGFVRQVLWRLASAKGDDVLLFLGILLTVPWLFLISLIGFIVATLFHVKTWLEYFWNQLRFHVLY